VHWLLEKGATMREASQLSALFHGDYASVPVKTRQLLNRILFTPVFPIVMADIQTQMIASAGKVLGNTVRMKKSKAKDNMLASGLIALVGGALAMDTVFRSLGYKREKFGYRYYREVVDSDGNNKELVVSFPNPGNAVMRHLNMFSFWPQSQKEVGMFINRAKYRFHPIWRTSTSIFLTNMREDGKTPVYNPYDDKIKIAEDVLTYAFTNIVAVFKKLDTMPMSESEKRMAVEALSDDLGVLAPIVRGLGNVYLREVKDKRDKMRMIHMMNEWQYFTRKLDVKGKERERSKERLRAAMDAVRESK